MRAFFFHTHNTQFARWARQFTGKENGRTLTKATTTAAKDVRLKCFRLFHVVRSHPLVGLVFIVGVPIFQRENEKITHHLFGLARRAQAHDVAPTLSQPQRTPTNPPLLLPLHCIILRDRCLLLVDAKAGALPLPLASRSPTSVAPAQVDDAQLDGHPPSQLAGHPPTTPTTGKDPRGLPAQHRW